MINDLRILPETQLSAMSGFSVVYFKRGTFAIWLLKHVRCQKVSCWKKKSIISIVITIIIKDICIYSEPGLTVNYQWYELYFKASYLEKSVLWYWRSMLWGLLKIKIAPAWLLCLHVESVNVNSLNSRLDNYNNQENRFQRIHMKYLWMRSQSIFFPINIMTVSFCPMKTFHIWLNLYMNNRMY